MLSLPTQRLVSLLLGRPLLHEVVALSMHGERALVAERLVTRAAVQHERARAVRQNFVFVLLCVVAEPARCDELGFTL